MFCKSSSSHLNESFDSAFQFEEKQAKNLCFKIFLVASIILAAIVICIGALALMTVKGLLSNGTKLSVIGDINSYVMLGGGIALFILGILAWSCHHSQENRLAHRTFKKNL